jgi:hypothetical protein
MNDQPTPRLVSLRCQHCDAHIEFDASGFQEGDTATVKCPDCLFDTMISVPVLTPESQPEKKPSSQSLSRLSSLANWFQTPLTSRFERTVFAITRLFAMCWAVLMVLALALLTFNYISSFFESKAGANPGGADTGNHGFIAKLIQSDFWQNLGIYLAAASVILASLTVVSIVLLLLAIERNTRRKE